MASNSSEVVESLDHPLSRAVDGDSKTYFESEQGSHQFMRFQALVEGH